MKPRRTVNATPFIVSLITGVLAVLFLIPTIFAWYKSGDFALSGIIGEFTGATEDGVDVSLGWLILFTFLTLTTSTFAVICAASLGWGLWRVVTTDKAKELYQDAHSKSSDLYLEGKAISKVQAAKGKLILEERRKRKQRTNSDK